MHIEHSGLNLAMSHEVHQSGQADTEERERACDEEVVRMGGEPHVYAESILKICEFYLASPVACAAGVRAGNSRNESRAS
jgi:beta-lactamase regulating signal transducer with metallopeptidase domain